MVNARHNDPLSAILQESTDVIGTTLEQIEWAESEIAAAIARHPAQGDLLHHGFGLLVPTHDLMATEFVSRSHYRELLDRLAAGQDTRPGTAAEVACACAEASQQLAEDLRTVGGSLNVLARATDEERRDLYEALGVRVDFDAVASEVVFSVNPLITTGRYDKSVRRGT